MSEIKKHVYHKCNDDRCCVCNGGLASCDVCGGGEASLPTECPGVGMTEEQSRAVRYGKLDFIGGVWMEIHRSF